MTSSLKSPMESFSFSSLTFPVTLYLVSSPCTYLRNSTFPSSYFSCFWMFLTNCSCCCYFSYHMSLSAMYAEMREGISFSMRYCFMVWRMLDVVVTYSFTIGFGRIWNSLRIRL